MWFESLTGFREDSPTVVRDNIVIDGSTLLSLKNGQAYVLGRLETPTLKELRERVASLDLQPAQLSLREVIADVQGLHLHEENNGATFQVASQFNLLEMVSPSITPEEGVDIYEDDLTQGPACAIAAGAGTIYRNYFVPVNGQVGQSASNQIDCLADIGAAMGNEDNRLWKMQNGYMMPSRSGLTEISERLENARDDDLDTLRKKLRVGVQWDTQVTLDKSDNVVTQVFCSALPVSYTNLPPSLWGGFARLILEAAYEATLCVALLNSVKTGNNKVYLTLLGGGAFGNDPAWISKAVRRCLGDYQMADLDIAFVSFRSPSKVVEEIITAQRNDD